MPILFAIVLELNVVILLVNLSVLLSSFFVELSNLSTSLLVSAKLDFISANLGETLSTPINVKTSGILNHLFL